MTKTDKSELAKLLAGDAEIAIIDPAKAQKAIADRIMAAETLDDVFDMSGSDASETILNRTFKLTETPQVHKSGFEKGPGAYMVITAVFDDTGEVKTFNCGGVNVMHQMAKLQEFGKLDLTLKIIKAEKPTASGYYPLWLQPA